MMRTPFFSGEPFERLVALMIAFITIVAAFAAYLEANASTYSDTALRQAQQFALQGMGVRTRGEVQASYAWTDAYRLWLEMDTQAFAAQQQGDEALAASHLAVRDRLSEVSPLLAPPYFDATSTEMPDINAYEADLYLVEATSLEEHFANKAAVSDAWDGKAGAYVTQLTLLTVALFLFGLSTTIVGKARWLFVGIGTIITNVTLAWMIVVVLTPVTQLPDAAIDTYAQGVGLAFQNENPRAIQAFDRALALAPGFGDAYYERAKAHADLAEYEPAVADYQRAMANGRDDVYARWNLGWTYYLMGRFEDSLAATEEALALAPEQIALHFNLALASLAEGEFDAARTAYEIGMEMASQQVAAAHAQGLEPPATLWWYLDASAGDLDRLVQCLDGERCEQAPPAGAVRNPAATRQMADQQRLALKELTTALEYTGQPPLAEARPVTVSSLDFVQPVLDDGGATVGYKPLDVNGLRLRGTGVFENQGEGADLALRRGSGVNSVYAAFDYRGIQPDDQVVVKVYVDGREASGLRLAQTWTADSQGRAALPLTPGGTYALTSGDYRVELYINAHLMQTGSFSIP